MKRKRNKIVRLGRNWKLNKCVTESYLIIIINKHIFTFVLNAELPFYTILHNTYIMYNVSRLTENIKAQFLSHTNLMRI